MRGVDDDGDGYVDEGTNLGIVADDDEDACRKKVLMSGTMSMKMNLNGLSGMRIRWCPLLQSPT